MKQIIFSGIAPSGTIHIGNYLGAIKNWIKLQNEYNSIFCVVDEHAITTYQKPEELRKKILEVTMLYIASGIDPEKSIIFIQSDVSAHAELSWILNTITPLGELQRMTQFKDKSKKQEQVMAGLLNYPVLMAADILLYKTDAVPVGEDQIQHIEFTRTLARKFNNTYGKIFKEPKNLVQKQGARIMGLDNPVNKMSKSAKPENYIAILDTPDEIKRKIKIAVTDSDNKVKYSEKEKHGLSNLILIYHLFSGLDIKKIEANHKTYSELKNSLSELIIEKLSPIQEKYRRLSENPDQVLKILKNGAITAEKIAQKTMQEVREKIGFI